MRQSPSPAPRLDQEQNTPKVPGIIATLSAGFELTSKHLWLILLPVLLDVFFWLGPRLSIQGLVERSLAVFAEEPSLANSIEQLLAIAPQINLFTSLSIPIIGIPALMSGGMPEDTPIEPAVYALDNASVWFMLVIGLSLVGLLLATLYLGLIARSIRSVDTRLDTGRFLATLARAFLRLIGLGVAFVVLVVAVSLPLLPLALVLAFFSGALSTAVMTMGVVLVAVYLSLAVPGILLGRRPLVPAILESFRLVRANLLSTVGFYLLIIIISNGINLLWHMADDGSWLTLISIVGHGFISTSLAAAIFIFYRDRFVAWQSRLLPADIKTGD